MLKPRSIVFSMTGSLNRKFTGGMASLNRNILLALTDLAQDHHLPLRVLSYVEVEADRPPFLPDWVIFEPFHHVKRPVFERELALIPSYPLFIFDHVSLAFPLIPFAAVHAAKTVIYAHDAEASTRIQRSSRWSLRFAALTLVHSNYVLRQMHAAHVAANTVLCFPGLSPEFPLNSSIPPPLTTPLELTAADGNSYQLGSRVLLIVARMAADPGKGHHDLIQALPALRVEFPEVQLVMPGPGVDHDNLEALARSVGVGSSVFLPGYTPTALLEQLYRQCYAFVMPSVREGFGLVYLEAMNCAKPCLGCATAGASDVIVDGETGILVNCPTDAQELHRAISALLSNPERAAQMGERGFARLHANFTSARYQARFRQVIEPLL